MDTIQFTPIKMDANGNSRVVCGWWNFGTKTYAEAIHLAHRIGGSKFNNKTFGGGIVFQLTSTTQLEKQIHALRAEYLKANEPQPEPVRVAYFVSEAITDENGNYIPCLATENEPGYTPTNWQYGKDFNLAQKTVDGLNERLGLTKEDAIKIVLSSMRPRKPAPGTEEEGQSMIEFSVVLALLFAVIFGAWLGASTIAHALNPLLIALGLD